MSYRSIVSKEIEKYDNRRTKEAAFGIDGRVCKIPTGTFILCRKYSLPPYLPDARRERSRRL